MSIPRRHYALYNLGRDKSPTRSTAPLDRRMVRRVKANVPDENSVVFWVEINEGDDNDEMALIEDVFPDWRLMCRATREPIMVSPDLAELVARVNVDWVPKTAVRRWSPQRSVNSVVLKDGEVLRTFHPAAGPHTVAPRPVWARGPLRKSWNNVYTTEQIKDRANHAHGKHVTEMFDGNHYAYPHVPGALEVVHQRTDYGTAYAAPGYRADFRALSPVEMDADSHDLQRMVGRYTKKGGE